MSASWYENGQPVEAVSLASRALQFGDGLFETIAIRGGAPRLWDYHVERLQTGCRRLGLAAPDRVTLDSALEAALHDRRLPTGAAKIIVTAGDTLRGYPRGNSPPQLFTGLFEAPPWAGEVHASGVDVRICTTRLAVQPQLAGIKTLNRLEQVLARAEWDDDGIFEGLTLDTGGRIICGTMSNVFIIESSKVMTPALTRCGVAGVMRRHVMTVLANRGIEVEATDIDTQRLMAADAVFLTNSQFGVLPVRSIDAHRYDKLDLVDDILSDVAASGIEECHR